MDHGQTVQSTRYQRNQSMSHSITVGSSKSVSTTVGFGIYITSNPQQSNSSLRRSAGRSSRSSVRHRRAKSSRTDTSRANTVIRRITHTSNRRTISAPSTRRPGRCSRGRRSVMNDLGADKNRDNSTGTKRKGAVA